MQRAEGVEETLWSFVADMLSDPERVRAGVKRLAEQERAARRVRLVPDEETKLWTEKIFECTRKRAAYQDQQAAGLMTLAELSDKLAGLEETSHHAEAELSSLKASEDRAKGIEQDGEAIVQSLSKVVPEALRTLPPEERLGVYQRLNLEVKPAPEGYEVTGAFCTSERSRS
jgi:chromosome segregation ATPase